MFHSLTQNTIRAFKFRAQASFSLLERRYPLVYKIRVREIVFNILHYKYPRNLCAKNLDTKSFFFEIESHFKSVQFLLIHPV